MKIDEDAREQLMQEMNLKGQDLWIELASEVHYFGRECPVWVLMKDKDSIQPIFELFLRVSLPYRERFDETEFSVSFQQISDQQIIFWRYVESHEIRAGQLDFPLVGEGNKESLQEGLVFKTVREILDAK